MKPIRSFASDNNAAVHPEVLEAIRRANEGHVVGYGDDPYTESAVAKFREHFGADVQVFFVFNGTAANVLSLQALTRPYHAVLCPELSHIYADECGAPEKFTGCRLITGSGISITCSRGRFRSRSPRRWGQSISLRKWRRWRGLLMSGKCFCT